ncbi:leucyl aminopeptidase [Kocuria koreensis]|uniref:Probable cytosol aminopeptidase n=1 Tax=Rothia koreensis TaxID=592378 RepID=A0A7K1LHY5_9MICC|nr:leucyl aminopeptidase [Rothia koreensis]MUN54673.1 leucyl aminopeptidase [Rothia koreensis]
MTESTDLAFSVISPDADVIEAQALVIGVVKGDNGPELAPSVLDADSADAIEASLEDLGVTGAEDSLQRLPGYGDEGPGLIALAGLGSLPRTGPGRLDALRSAAGSAVRQLIGLDSVALNLPAETLSEVAALAEGAAYGAFFDPGQRTDEEIRSRRPVSDVAIVSGIDREAADEALARALVLGEAVDNARRLVNQAPNDLYPETFADRAVERVSGIDHVTCEILDEKDLEAGGFGGILGVGRGSARTPRLVKVDYNPDNARKSVALVGKGITFDSGGISLKPGASMMTMKCDMGGAAAVLNAVAAAGELELPVRVTGYLCIAENMPSGTATKPNDVLSMRGGKTVEVLNTDAEGRLVMADGLAYASESDPDYLLDVATLTGAQMVALGTRHSAVMGEEELRGRVIEASERAGEQFWPMPLPAHMRGELNTEAADLKNIGAGRNGGMLIAGLFLQEFVGESEGKKIPWAHLDIAGPAYNEGSPYGFVPKNGTGASVSTLVSLIEDLAD